MDQKLALTSFTRSIADAANLPQERVGAVLDALFSLVEAELIKGNNVKVKGLGTFKISTVEPRETRDLASGERITIGAYRRVSFTPEKALAELVNAPFSAFESVELSSDLSQDELELLAPAESAAAAEEEPVADNSETSYNSETSESSESSESSETSDNSDNSESSNPEPAPAVAREIAPVEMPEIQWAEDTESSAAEQAEEADSSAPQAEAPANEAEQAEAEEAASETAEAAEDTADYPEEEEEEDTSSAKHKPHFWLGVLAGVGCTVAILLGLWAWRYFAPDSFTKVTGLVTTSTMPAPAAVQPKATPTPVASQKADQEEKLKEEAAPAVDTEATPSATDEVPTKPSDQPVYDYISKTRFLTTMAKEHYGDYNLWPFIYKENEAMLGHPDRIRPGTKIVIPPASKYGIDASDPACVAKAKKMGAAIYSRYRK